MQIAPGQFAGSTDNNAFSAPDNYCISAAGIKAGEYSSLIPWPAIELIEAWKTTGEGNDGWEEILHIRLRDSQGNSLQINDFAEVMFFSDLRNAINYYLSIEINWYQGDIDAEYQQRRRKWHRGWFGSRRKPVIYNKLKAN